MGCTNGCSYCYARGQAKRQKRNCQLCYDFVPHLHEERLEQPLKRKKPATIFLGSMCDLWDPNVPLAWRQKIWDVVEKTPQHTYLVLTKQPQNYTYGERQRLDHKGSNLWRGVTVEGRGDEWRLDSLWDTATHGCFVSFEPLLGLVDLDLLYYVDWAIIGAQTGSGGKQPEGAWITSICKDIGDVPLFAKNNLDWPAELGPKPKELPYLNEPEAK